MVTRALAMFLYIYILLVIAASYSAQDLPGLRWGLYALPVLPFLLRVPLFIQYRCFMNEQLSEDERDSKAGKTTVLTMAGFSFSALFILLANYHSINISKEYAQIVVYFIFVAVAGFFTVFSMETYKFSRWEQHVSVCLEDMGKLGLVASAGLFAWGSPIDATLKHIIVFFFGASWLFDYIKRLSLWHEYFAARKRAV